MEDITLHKKLRQIICWSNAFGGILALAFVLAWVIYQPAATYFGRHHLLMAPAVAGLVLLLQVAIFFYYQAPASGLTRRRVAILLAGIVLVLSTVSLVDGIVGGRANLGILASGNLQLGMVQNFYRMPLLVALGVWISVWGCFMIFVNADHRMVWWVTFAIGILSASIGSVSTVSFLFLIPFGSGSSLGPVDLFSAISISIVGVILMLEASCKLPPLQKLYRPTIPNRLLWIFLPVTFGLIFLQNWLEVIVFEAFSISNPVWRYSLTAFMASLIVIGVIYLAAKLTGHEIEKAENALKRTAYRYETFFSSSYSGLALTDEQGVVLYEAPAVTRILGYQPEDRLGHWFFGFADEDQIEKARTFFSRALGAGCDRVTTQLCVQKKNGEKGWLEVAITNFLGDPQIQAVIIHYNDITETQRSSETLLRRADQLASLNEIAGKIQRMYSVDELMSSLAGLIKENLRYDLVALYSWIPKENILVLKDLVGRDGVDQEMGAQFPADVSMVGQTAQRAKSHLVSDTRQEEQFIDPPVTSFDIAAELCVPIFVEGMVSAVLDLHSPVKDGFSTNDLLLVETLAGQFSDALEKAKLYDDLRLELAERTQAEIALSESEFWIVESQRVANVGSYVLDFSSKQWTNSKMLNEIFGIGENYDRSIDGWASLVHPEHREMMLQYISDIVVQKGVFDKEYKIIRPIDQAVRWIHGRGELILDIDGIPQRMFGIIQDITDRKLNEVQLRAALAEKEVLLKEIHHRVKNNLQIVSSLLSLRSEMISEPQAVLAFKDCQNEVRAISLIHENIYQTMTLAHVDVGEYIPKLAKYLLAAFGRSASDIALDIHVEPFQLDLDFAVPCGLIVTELFTNSIKHAFPNDIAYPDGKQISVVFSESEDELTLMVRDNGQGLPEEFSLEGVNSLGLQLVSLLTQQLHGTVSFESHEGASFVITFPTSDKRKKA